MKKENSYLTHFFNARLYFCLSKHIFETDYLKLQHINYLHKHILPYYINDTTLRAIQKEPVPQRAITPGATPHPGERKK